MVADAGYLSTNKKHKLRRKINEGTNKQINDTVGSRGLYGGTRGERTNRLEGDKIIDVHERDRDLAHDWQSQFETGYRLLNQREEKLTFEGPCNIVIELG